MRFMKIMVLGFAFLVLPAINTAAHAQQGDRENGINQAIQSVEQQTGGRVLSAEKRRVNGQSKYRLKVITPSGRVRIIYIDAN